MLWVRKGGGPVAEERSPKHRQARERAVKLEQENSPTTKGRKLARETGAENIQAP